MNSSSPKILPASRLVSLRRFDLAIKYVYAKAFLRWGDCLPLSIRRCYRDLVWAANGAIEPDRSKKGLAQFETQYRSLICSLQAEGYNPGFKPVTVCSDGKVEDGAHRVAACWALKLALPVLVEQRLCRADMGHVYLLRRGLWPDWLDACLAEVLEDLPVLLRVQHGDQVGAVGLSTQSLHDMPLVCVYEKTLPASEMHLKILEVNTYFSGWVVRSKDFLVPQGGRMTARARLPEMLTVQILEPAFHPYRALKHERERAPSIDTQAAVAVATAFKQLLEITSFTERYMSDPALTSREKLVMQFFARPSDPNVAKERHVSWCHWLGTRTRLLCVGLLGRFFRTLIPWRCEKWLAKKVPKHF